MRAFEFILNFVAILLLSKLKPHSASKAIYICEAENPSFIGTYVPGHQQQDGVDVYSNENDMSFFRNRGFWYLGNLAPWPPETHYRCVEPEGCSFNEDLPPTNAQGTWRGNKKFNNPERAPVISATPCGTPAHPAGEL